MSIDNEEPKYRRYWPVPPLIDRIYEYQDVNKDIRLRRNVTEFFTKKVIKWIDMDKDFTQYKNKKNFILSDDGFIHIYNLLRNFVKRANINWYDLRDNYPIIKHYLCKKL